LPFCPEEVGPGYAKFMEGRGGARDEIFAVLCNLTERGYRVRRITLIRRKKPKTSPGRV
jgi:hypothetical protein